MPMPLLKPFSAHTQLAQQYESFLGGGDPLGLAKLVFTSLTPPITVPVTHTMEDNDYEQLQAGRSVTRMYERCEFRVSLIPENQRQYLKKGLPCSLYVNAGAPAKLLQLWAGGMMEGGEIYRFRLADVNYHV